jgi:3-hydroxyacyl-[acyl-carrier-protein] dehydratase
MNTGSARQSVIQVPKDHPAFAGHFPGFAVLPGAVLLDEVLRAIEGQRGVDLTKWCITSAKFLSLVRPGGSIRFTVSSADRRVANGSLSVAAEPLDSP